MTAPAARQPLSPAAETSPDQDADPVTWSLPPGYEPSESVVPISPDRSQGITFAPPGERLQPAPASRWRQQTDKARLETIERQLSGPRFRRSTPTTLKPRGRREDPRGSLLDIERRTLEFRTRETRSFSFDP